LRNINLTVEEWRVVSFVNPRNTIRQIARANNLSDFEIRRIVYGMLQAGLVEIVRTAKPQVPTPTPTPGKPPTARQEARKEIEQQSPAAKRSVVVRLIDRIRGL
jgi:hypothetical protein